MQYIETSEQLIKSAKEWKRVIGIDIECENNLHHYGSYISLIQISTKDHDYVIDVLAVKNFAPLIDVLENPGIQKIFHDVGFDLRLIHKTFNTRPKNIFDTQIAALLLGKEQISLASLLKEYLDIKKEKKFQMADWTKRPLTKMMLDYAVNDTKYLIELRNILIEKLKQKNRLDWVQEECQFVENNEWEYRQGTFLDVKGLRLLTDQQRAIMKRLYELRDDLAREVDRPVHFIISTRKLFSLVQELPINWNKLKQVHPIVKKKSNLFSIEVNKGLQETLPLPEKKKFKFSSEEKNALEQLGLLRNAAAEKYSIQPHLIMNRDQMQTIVLDGNMNCLRDWQKKIVKSL